MKPEEIIAFIMFAVIVIFIAAAIILFSKLIKSLHDRKKGKELHVQFLYNVIKVVVVFAAILIVAYQIPGVEKTASTLLASGGVVALAISFMAQEAISNLINGFFIIIFKPFKIGDRVTLPEKNNITGIVTSVNLRHTIITTFQNTSYIISNSVMSNCVVENSNFKNETFSYPIDVVVSYDSDIDLAMEVMKEVVTSHPKFIDKRTPEEIEAGVPIATVFARELGDNGISLRCPMVTENVSVSFLACSEVRVNLKKAFDKAGIVIPYNTVTVIKQKK